MNIYQILFYKTIVILYVLFLWVIPLIIVKFEKWGIKEYFLFVIPTHIVFAFVIAISFFLEFLLNKGFK